MLLNIERNGEKSIYITRLFTDFDLFFIIIKIN